VPAFIVQRGGDAADPLSMAILAIFIALVIEQLRPLQVQAMVSSPLGRLSAWVLAKAGNRAAQRGRLPWWVVVLATTLGTALAHSFLWDVHPTLAFAFNVATLYWAIGFSGDHQRFADINLALRMGELDHARRLLGEWRGADSTGADESEVARLAIEQALVSSHRNVFAVIFWFVVLPGPSGAVLYRVARFLREDWARQADSGFGERASFARRAFELIDWLPVRLTAASLSVVGDFEDALYCWRTQSMNWPDKSSAILIAAGGGALGVKLGMPIHQSGEIVERPEMGLGEETSADHMRGVVRLIWRALVVCLLVLILLTLAGVAGS